MAPYKRQSGSRRPPGPLRESQLRRRAAWLRRGVRGMARRGAGEDFGLCGSGPPPPAQHGVAGPSGRKARRGARETRLARRGRARHAPCARKSRRGLSLPAACQLRQRYPMRRPRLWPAACRAPARAACIRSKPYLSHHPHGRALVLLALDGPHEQRVLAVVGDGERAPRGRAPRMPRRRSAAAAGGGRRAGATAAHRRAHRDSRAWLCTGRGQHRIEHGLV